MRRMLSKQLVLMALCWGCLVAVGHTAEPSTPGPSIVVEADGKVMAVPDQARLTVAVETQAPQAEAAAQENARRAEALVKALKQSLAPDDQVKTLGYRLSPVYAPKNKSGPPVIKAYQAVHRFQVKLKGPERLGSVIDLALKNGASGVNGPFWEHSRIEELQREAAVAALARARRLAEALAQSQGLKITGVERVSTNHPFHVVKPASASQKMMAAAPAPTTPIEVGEDEIKSNVWAVFQVKP